MKTVLEAFFGPDGLHLVTITAGKFHCYRIDTTGGELNAAKLWEYKLSQVFWIAFGRDVIIASNTSDKHVAVSLTTGELLWERSRPKNDGISGQGIIIGHGDSESYVFTGYKNVFQSSTLTGEDTCAPWPIDRWTSNLHDLGDSRVGVIVKRANNHDHYSIGVLDLDAQALEIRSDLSPDLLRPAPAPDGSKCVAFRVGEPTGSLEVLGVPSTTSHSSYTMRKGHTVKTLAWSPERRWIGATTVGVMNGCLLFDSTLTRVASITELGIGTPAFHPDEKHVVIPRRKTTRIESIEALFDEHALPR